MPETDGRGLGQERGRPSKPSASAPRRGRKATRYLRELLNRPDDSLEQLAKLLASKAKARVGLFQSRVSAYYKITSMLNLAIAPLIKKARARTNDPIQLSVISLLEMLATDVSAGER